jgi:hypothetical protein
VVELARDGTRINVTELKDQGLRLENETSAWPLGLAIKFQRLPPQLVQKMRVNEVTKLDLRIALEDGRLRLTGARLPLSPGIYELFILVSGLKLSNPVTFEIPQNGEAVVRLEEERFKRKFVLSTALDALTQGILDRSTLDGLSAMGWLADPARRLRRKACLLNVLAKLRLPKRSKEPLSAGISRVFFADVDRIYAELQPDFVDRLVETGSGFKRDSGRPHPTHLRLKQVIPNPGAYGDLMSFREQVTSNSVQLNVVQALEDPLAPVFADIDIDLGNPFVDLTGFVVHIGELLNPDTTNHLALHAKLAKSACKEFLYYKLVKAAAA